MANLNNDRLPPILDCSNLGKEWPVWKRTFLMYMMANGKLGKETTESTKISLFNWLIGPQAGEIYNTLFPNDGSTEGILGIQQQQSAAAAIVAAPQNQRTLDDVLKAFDDYCIPRKNITMESFKFNTISQKEKQPFAEFETDEVDQFQYIIPKIFS